MIAVVSIPVVHGASKERYVVVSSHVSSSVGVSVVVKEQFGNVILIRLIKGESDGSTAGFVVVLTPKSHILTSRLFLIFRSFYSGSVKRTPLGALAA